MNIKIVIDDSVSPKEINHKRIKKVVECAIRKSGSLPTQVKVYVEKYGSYCVNVKATFGAEVFISESEHSCMTQALETCLKNTFPKRLTA